MTVTAIALFSGGLDSMLACRVVAEQGIRVEAVKFVSPFFGYDLLAREKEYAREVYEKYGIDVRLRDVSEQFLELLHNPPHGFGKNFNPCVDCKILLVSEARKMMDELGASFIITGEVIGQRPMSQRRDTLRVIERDSGSDGLLLRPLCAKNLPPTKAELDGLIDRERLLNFNGRGRTPQMELAARFGITDYPGPAGGCILTDPIVGKRIERFYQEKKAVTVNDALLLQAGRQFRLPGGGWLVMGRDNRENKKILALRESGDRLLKAQDRPGPTGIVRYTEDAEDIRLAAALVLRYGKKVKNGPAAAPVWICRVTDEVSIPGSDVFVFPVEEDILFPNDAVETVIVGPMDDARSRPWAR